MKIFLTAAFLICVAPVLIWANMAAPSQGGNLSGEPNGLENIFIRRERLSIDFRQMETGQEFRASQTGRDLKKIGVEAVYEIENTAADESLTLVFVLGSSEVGNFEFYLDERKISAQITDAGDLPPSWKTPLFTPWHDGKELGFFPSRSLQKTARIELTIPKGAHTLKAQYKSSYAYYDGYAPRQLYQFAYILAPARDWAGFGGLDLTVYLPEGWEMLSSPKLDETGATIQAHFDRIPADALAFTFGKPLPPGYYRLDAALYWLAVLCVFVPPLVLGWLFWRMKQKGKISPALGFLLSLPWAILVGAACFASVFLANRLYPTISYGYGDAFYVLLIPVFCIVIYLAGSLLWLAGALMANKTAQAAIK